MADKSMRDQLAEAFNKKVEDEEEVEAGGSQEDTEEPVRDTGEEEAPEVTGAEDSDGGDGRDDEDNAERDADPAAAKDDKGGDGDKSRVSEDGQDKGADAELKAPASWKPAIREHWGKLPKEVRAEITRREQEIEKGLYQASGYKRMAGEYYNLVRPYEHLIRAKNSTPAQAITNLMQTAAGLQMGSKVQKAQIVFNILKEYDVDIETLDSLLVGKTPPKEESDLSRVVDEKLAPIKSFIEEVRGSRTSHEQKAQEEAASELEKFATDPKNEFFNDLADDIADIMELAAKRGQKVSLKEAYDRAAALNPEISKILQQRERARKGEIDRQALEKKKAAASSVVGHKSGDATRGGESSDLRSSLAQAWADVEEARG